MISASILQTLKYSDHFGFPLTLDEIYLRLISFPITQIRLIRQIRQMLANHQIQQSGEYFYLPGHKSLIAERRQKAKTSAAQLSRAQALANQLGRLPGILAIYLTGSLALSNSKEHDDIDYMVITRPRRLWTTRLLLTLYTELLGVRRQPNTHDISGKVCLNLYLTPDSYLLPKSKRSLYTAYELIQAVPLFDPIDTHSALLSANPWIKTYLPNFPMPKQQPISLPENRSTGLLEYFMYHLQLAYMKPKLTREFITPDSAFFHPRNPAPRV